MRWLASILLVGLGLTGACDCGDGPDPSRPCTDSTDCPVPLVCVDDVCVAADSDGGGVDGSMRRDGDTPPADGSDNSDTGVCASATGTPGRLPVDIIIIVDQSASTGEEAAAIEANINTNLGDVLERSGLDYRVILINSSPALCPEPPLGVAGDCLASNPPTYQRITQPVNNSDELTLLLWTYEGAGKAPNTCHRNDGVRPAWRDFIRFDSLKVFIVFSDDDPTTFTRNPAPPVCPGRPAGGSYNGCSIPDCLSTTGTRMDCGNPGNCPNFGCPTFADMPADWGGGDFPTELYALPPQMMVDGRMENPFGSADNPRWVFHSIIGVNAVLEPADPVTDRCAICNTGGNTAENAGVTYQKLSRLTGGIRFPSCNPDYSPLFGRISSDIAPIACEFTLDDTGLGMVDPARTNVLYFPDGMGPPFRIPQDNSAVCDAGANGWQFVGGETRIRICGSLCDQIQMDPNARVQIEVGCMAETCPPACADGGVPVDSGMCRPELCTNGIDDDCDGLADDQDRDCILF